MSTKFQKDDRVRLSPKGVEALRSSDSNRIGTVVHSRNSAYVHWDGMSQSTKYVYSDSYLEHVPVNDIP